MHLVSVNIGREQPLLSGNTTEMTGIFKRPVQESVELTALGLAGDAVVDVEHHGGPDQAVYVYGEPDYVWWSAQLGYELEPGTFGENFTIAGLESALLNVGDLLHVGAVALQVTAARIPCSTLAARMGAPDFVKRFRAAERPGAYCRVLRTGVVWVGDAVTLVRYPGETVSITEMFREYYNPRPSDESIRRHLAAPIATRARAAVEAKQRKLAGESAR